MTRYVRRPTAYVYRDSDAAWFASSQGVSSITVCEAEPSSRFSGVYDAEGFPLHRQESTRPIGFLKTWEE